MAMDNAQVIGGARPVLGVNGAKRKAWKDATVAAIRAEMDDILGANSVKSVLYHLKDKGITIDDVVERPKQFIDALSSIFGSGAKAIELALVHGVGETTGINAKGMSLDQALSKAQSNLNSLRH
jgi:phosphoribosylpyrophosphate synthetase